MNTSQRRFLSHSQKCTTKELITGRTFKRLLTHCNNLRKHKKFQKVQNELVNVHSLWWSVQFEILWYKRHPWESGTLRPFGFLQDCFWKISTAALVRTTPLTHQRQGCKAERGSWSWQVRLHPILVVECFFNPRTKILLSFEGNDAIKEDVPISFVEDLIFDMHQAGLDTCLEEEILLWILWWKASPFHILAKPARVCLENVWELFFGISPCTAEVWAINWFYSNLLISLSPIIQLALSYINIFIN